MYVNIKKYIVEFFGTMILIIIGCGSIAFGGAAISNLEIALCFGITLTVLYYFFEPISGCHLNPAVSIAMLTLKKITNKDAFWYILFQCFGAIFGSILLYMIAVTNPNFNIHKNGLGQNELFETKFYNYDVFIAFITELCLTAFFVGINISTSYYKNKILSGFIIGLTLVVILIMGINFTGVSVNPARSIGPAFVVGGNALKQLWIFILAPIFGSLIAAGIWTIVEKSKQLNKEFKELIKNE